MPSKSSRVGLNSTSFQALLPHTARFLEENTDKMSGRFAPKVPVQLDPPKDDPISVQDLEKANGTNGEKSYVAIKGKVYDVSGNKMYQPGGSYHVFAGKDASRALGMTSVKPEDVRPDWHDLPDKEKGVLEDWITFFSKRYNVVGVVEGATNQ